MASPVERQDHLPQPAGSVLLMHTRVALPLLGTGAHCWLTGSLLFTRMECTEVFGIKEAVCGVCTHCQCSRYIPTALGLFLVHPHSSLEVPRTSPQLFWMLPVPAGDNAGLAAPPARTCRNCRRRHSPHGTGEQIPQNPTKNSPKNPTSPAPHTHCYKGELVSLHLSRIKLFP